MGKVVITAALRTPIAKFQGTFQRLSAADLGVAVVAGLLRQTGVRLDAVDELVFGNARQAGGGPNVARQVAIRSGLPQEVPAYTVNMACGSGLKAILLAAEAIALGRTEVAVAGGTESMTNLPFLLPRFRQGYRLGHAETVDAMYRDGFLDPIAEMVMGETAEKLAKERRIPREEQDRFAMESQRQCEAARKEGRFQDEIFPVEVAEGGGRTKTVSEDEHPRDGVTLESLAKLPPVFDPKGGTVTAGNSSGITDGAAALLLMSAEAARKRGQPALAEVGLYTFAGVDPSIMGIGPVPAVRELVRKNGIEVDRYDLIELNEAFAAQVIACVRDLGLPKERLNVNGGAIALGHPIGCSGARIVVTLLHEMRRRKARNGLATLCISGGMGIAAAFQRV